MQNELKRKDELEKSVVKLEKKTETLNDTRTKLFTQIGELDALILKKKMMAKEMKRDM